MDLAVHNGDLEIVKYLHSNRSEGCDRALVFASRKNHFDVVKYLVENELGLDRIQVAIVEAQIVEDHSEIVKYLEVHTRLI